MDWNVDDKPPMRLGLALQVWMANGNVRKVVFDQWCGFRFTDCTHPWQNVFCSPDYIKGWKLMTVRKISCNAF